MPRLKIPSAFEAMSLKEQCAALSLPLEQMDVDYDPKERIWRLGALTSRNPENVVAHAFHTHGSQVACCESGPILLMMKSLSFQWFADNHAMGVDDARTRYFEALCTIYRNREAEIRDKIRACTKERYIDQFEYIYGSPFIAATYPSVSRDLMSLLYDNFLENIFGIFDVFMKAPYDYRSGWPDVIVANSKQVRFYEVKTTDRLHKSQIRIINDFRDICRLDFRVLNLKPSAV